MQNSRIEVHRVYVDVDTIIMAGSLLTAVVVIFLLFLRCTSGT